MRTRLAAVFLLAACASVPREDLLLEDCGGFRPTIEQAGAAASLAGLDALSPADRVTLLRAGLRLRDAAAARACAALLTWQQIDRWECARCVDLLVEDVLLPDSRARFEEFRSYIGSVELKRYLDLLPPLPWSVDTVSALSQMHRIARAEHIPDFVALTRHPDPAVSGEAFTELELLGRWNDDFREEVQAAFLGVPVDPSKEAGLPAVLVASLRRDHLERGDEGPGPELPAWDRRWLWECTPGPKDADLLMALAQCGDAPWDRVAGAAFVLLGRLSDPVTEAFLRLQAEEGHALAEWALARRGDAAMRETLLRDARDGDDFALALVMEIDPAGARRLLEEVLLGPDDGAAHRMLEELSKFATPGAFYEPLGFDWRRTSFEGLEQAALRARVPALRLARIGYTVPGCRTRALGIAAALALRPGDLIDDGNRNVWSGDLFDIGTFLEVAAPAEFAAALRTIRAAGGPDAALATEWLIRMADRETCAALCASMTNDEHFARSGAPEVRRVLEERVRRALAAGEFEQEDAMAVGALAIVHGFPEHAAEVFWKPFTIPASAEAVLAGRPVDGLAALLAERPDEWCGDIGGVDDPRVRAYLVRLRERRDLGLYWYATGQLAAGGDPSARADFWGAMQDGRYRIMDNADRFERTLGCDLKASMPFWIAELRSQCCRMVTSGAGDVVEDCLGLDNAYQSPFRTTWRRANELWDASGGEFLWSRIAGHGVPRAR